MAESIDCPVCISAIEDDIFVTKCGHKFCKTCIVNLLTHPPQRFVEHGLASCPVCRQSMSALDITNQSNGGKPLIERPTTIYGGVYIQGGTEGLASYHFSEDESYISYSAAPATWRLDDGSAPPERKPFLHSTYIPAIRTFRAIVDWSDVNFHGDAQWIYRIVFSEDFMRIESGEVLSYDAAGQSGRWHVYGQHLLYLKQIKERDII